jgi:hypothetical protein
MNMAEPYEGDGAVRFVQTKSRDWVNLAHVTIIERSQEKAETYVLRNDKGRQLGEVTLDDAMATASQIVPAAAGQVATVIAVLDADDAPSAGERLQVSRYPIVAWRIYPHTSPEPILAQETSSNERVFVEAPGGVLLALDEREFPDTQAALDHLRRDLEP